MSPCLRGDRRAGAFFGVRALVFALVLSAASIASAEVAVPLRLHIVTGVEIEKRGVSMTSWISPADLQQTVMPAVNRIWRPADVRWVLRSVEMSEALSPADRPERLATIVNATRDRRGKSDPARIRAWEGLLDLQASDGKAVDVYLVPYLGEASQGNASRRHRRALVALWTDKPSRGKKPPRKAKLVESEPMRQGSLSRTIAHELGHVLGLRHPKKATQTTYGRLMGGKKPGYRLTAEERETARRNAEALASR